MPAESCWAVTGNIFVWLDENGSQTIGMLDTTSIRSPNITYTHSHVLNQTSNLNQSLDYNIHVKRYLSIESTITTSIGNKQDLSYCLPVGTKTEAAEVRLDWSYIPSMILSATAVIILIQRCTRALTATQWASPRFPADWRYGATLGTAARLSTHRNGTASLHRGVAGGRSSGSSDVWQNMQLSSITGGEHGTYLALFERNVSPIHDTTTENDVRVYGVNQGSPLNESELEFGAIQGWDGGQKPLRI